MTPTIAAVVVHYGDPAPTARCLDSLGGIDEVVLVDQPPRRFGDHPRVTRRIETPRNVGFAAACNLAVASTGADFVLLLNNDAWLAPASAGALQPALPRLAPDVAGACLKLLSPDARTIQSAGGLVFTRDGIGFPRGFGEVDRGQYDALREEDIGVPSGAAALYRTRAWREAGGMSEEFFCYCEDGDLGLRMVAGGGRFAWLPEVVALHELSATTGAHSRFKAFHVERNHFLAMVHVAPPGKLVLLPLLTLARIARIMLDAVRGRGAAGGLRNESSLRMLVTTLVRAWVEAAAATGRAWSVRRSLLRRHPRGLHLVGRHLASHRVTLDQFLRSRSLPFADEGRSPGDERETFRAGPRP